MVSGDKAPGVFKGGRAGGESPAYWYRGGLWNVLMSADETLGEFTFMEQIIPRGGSARRRTYTSAKPKASTSCPVNWNW